MGKQLTDDVVRTVANFLLLACGRTTTLDIRKNLEVLGYDADKDEISSRMDSYYQEGQNEEAVFFTGDKEAILKYEIVTFAGKTFRMYSFIDFGAVGALENWCYECDEEKAWCVCDAAEEIFGEDEDEAEDCGCACACTTMPKMTLGATKLKKIKVA